MEQLKQKILAIQGESEELGGNNPLVLDDQNFAWIVIDNKVNIFAVSTNDDETKGIRNFVCTVEKGGVFFGVKPDNNVSLIAVGDIGTRIIKKEISTLGENFPICVDSWLLRLGVGMSDKVRSARNFKLIIEGDSIEISKGENLLSLDKVLWVQFLKGDFLYFGKEERLIPKSEQFYPITKNIWIKSVDSTTINVLDSKQCQDQGILQENLTIFHELLMIHLRYFIDTRFGNEKKGLLLKEKNEEKVFSRALSELAFSIESEQKTSGDLFHSDCPIYKACLAVADKMKFKLREPSQSLENGTHELTIKDIARISKIRIRKVTLKKNWWTHDTGPLVGFLEDGNKPVALLPVSSTAYEIFNPEDNSRKKVDKQTSLKISNDAFILFKPFPNKELTLLDLVMFGFQAVKDDLKTFAIMGIAAGLLGIIIPIATGIIFDVIVPNRATDQLMKLGLGLFACSVSAAMFQLLQSISLIRMEGKLKASIQSALWDRIMSFPCSFFKMFSAGDLASRSLGIDTIMNQVFEGLVVPSILGAVYASFNFILLFFYDRRLAVISTILSFIVFVAITLTTALQLSNKRKETDIQGDLSGFVFQLINGIAKLKVSGAETLAFAKWADKFSEQKRYAYRAGITNNYLTVFNSVMPVISSITIFSFVTYQIKEADATGSSLISTGGFLAFNAAFTGFLMAIMRLGTSVATLANVIPLFERMKPILQTLQEDDTEKIAPGELSGMIEVNNLSFRYGEDDPLVLKEVSFTANPGEFVAFVGPSGSGKSTILRHLLGFEKPEHGAVYYDGKDLASLDLSEVRNQIGVVLQDSQLMAGEIYYNIIGSSLLTIDDAWEAAKLAGIDEDIKAMPMGMHTYVSEGGGTFSGGQKQRLLIARALAKKPRIILFDEATSALDNKTQNIITESINTLKSTRIVIAHRLSTVIKADRIFVVDKGEIVQSGNYESLINVEGAFKKIAERQLL